MPDSTLQTLSATEAPALFNASARVTRWLLFQKFARGLNINTIEEDDRMSEGKRMQPIIIAAVEQEKQLHIVSNADDSYVRRGRLGCTRDAIIMHPERGRAALEIKCVFDYKMWQSRWAGGEAPPRDYEIQLQTQMLVGDDEGSYEWGMICAWVGGSRKYFERTPNRVLWAQLEAESLAFFDDVEAGREPDPFGLPVELPWLQQMYPTKEGKVLDLREVSGADRFAAKGRQWLTSKATARNHAMVADALRAEFSAVAKDAERILLPGGGSISGFGKGKRLKVHIPGEEAMADD